MTQRNILIHVQVDSAEYEGQTDEQIMELLFQGNSLPGGATVTPITPLKVDSLDWEPLQILMHGKSISTITDKP